MKYIDADKRLLAAAEILNTDGVSREKLAAVRRLVRGIDPRLDKALVQVSKLVQAAEQINQGKVVEMTVEHLPAKTAEEKKRKKAMLLLMKWWKQLQSEVERLEREFKAQRVNKWERIMIKAKGPIGIITVAAIAVVGAKIWLDQKPVTTAPVNLKPSTQTIQAIKVGDKLIPMDRLTTAVGAECDGEHYHAQDHVAAEALDGSRVADPGGCGFGKVEEVKIETVEI